MLICSRNKAPVTNKLHVIKAAPAGELDVQPPDGIHSRFADDDESLDKSEVAAAYDRCATTYDIDANRTRELAAHILRQLQRELAGDTVIEIDCGTGYNTQWLGERARSVLALDFSEQMLRRAKARVRSPSVRFMQHDSRETGEVERIPAFLQDISEYVNAGFRVRV